eukprot:jgi/Botrbrau1/17798/Bobra.0127s0047.1
MNWSGHGLHSAGASNQFTHQFGPSSQELEAFLKTNLMRHRWILDLRHFDSTRLLEDFVEQHPEVQQLTVKDFEKRMRDAAAKNLPAAALYTGLCQLQIQGSKGCPSDTNITLALQWISRSLQDPATTEHARKILAQLQGRKLDSMLQDLLPALESKPGFLDNLDMSSIFLTIQKLFSTPTPEAWWHDLRGPIYNLGYKRTSLFLQALCASKGYGRPADLKAAFKCVADKDFVQSRAADVLKNWLEAKGGSGNVRGPATPGPRAEGSKSSSLRVEAPEFSLGAVEIEGRKEAEHGSARLKQRGVDIAGQGNASRPNQETSERATALPNARTSEQESVARHDKGGPLSRRRNASDNGSSSRVPEVPDAGAPVASFAVRHGKGDFVARHGNEPHPSEGGSSRVTELPDARAPKGDLVARQRNERRPSKGSGSRVTESPDAKAPVFAFAVQQDRGEFGARQGNASRGERGRQSRITEVLGVRPSGSAPVASPSNAAVHGSVEATAAVEEVGPCSPVQEKKRGRGSKASVDDRGKRMNTAEQPLTLSRITSSSGPGRNLQNNAVQGADMEGKGLSGTKGATRDGRGSRLLEQEAQAPERRPGHMQDQSEMVLGKGLPAGQERSKKEVGQKKGARQGGIEPGGQSKKVGVIAAAEQDPRRRGKLHLGQLHSTQQGGPVKSKDPVKSSAPQPDEALQNKLFDYAELAFKMAVKAKDVETLETLFEQAQQPASLFSSDNPRLERLKGMEVIVKGEKALQELYALKERLGHVRKEVGEGRNPPSRAETVKMLTKLNEAWRVYQDYGGTDMTPEEYASLEDEVVWVISLGGQTAMPLASQHPGLPTVRAENILQQAAKLPELDLPAPVDVPEPANCQEQLFSQVSETVCLPEAGSPPRENHRQLLSSAITTTAEALPGPSLLQDLQEVEQQAFDEAGLLGSEGVAGHVPAQILSEPVLTQAPSFMDQMFPQEKRRKDALAQSAEIPRPLFGVPNGAVAPEQQTGAVASAVARDNGDSSLLDRLCSVKDWERHFECPITLEPFKDPVVLSDGYTYERQNIEEWLKTKTASPVTGRELPDTKLIPNIYEQLLIKSCLIPKGFLAED